MLLRKSPYISLFASTKNTRPKRDSHQEITAAPRDEEGRCWLIDRKVKGIRVEPNVEQRCRGIGKLTGKRMATRTRMISLPRTMVCRLCCLYNVEKCEVPSGVRVEIDDRMDTSLPLEMR